MVEKVTLKWLVEKSGLQNLLCVAGENGLMNEISGVHIMDNPDTIRFFKEGEMILTTGYPLMNLEPVNRRELVDDLANRKCSGIAFKVNRYFGTIPDEIIEEANKLNLPVIQVPYDYSMAEVESKVLFQIFTLQNNHLQFAHELYSIIINCVLSGKGLYGICEQLLLHTGFHVAFLDETGMVVAVSGNEYHIGQGSKFFHMSEMKDLHARFTEGQFAIRTDKMIGTHLMHCRIWEMISGDTIAGYLCLFDAIDEEMSMSLIKAMEYVLPLLQIELLRFNTTNISSIRAKNELLEQLLLKHEDTNAKQLIYCCNIFGFNPDLAFECLVWKKSRNHVEEALQSILQKTLHKKREDYFLGETGDNVVCIYGESLDVDPAEHLKRGEQIVRSIGELYPEYANQGFGIGNSVRGVENICFSYENALLSQKVNSLVLVPFEKGRKQILAEIMYLQLDPEELHVLHDMTFKKLKEHDGKTGGSLEQTLRTYVLNDFKSKETADALFIHRNTLSQRLTKIQELIGPLKGENRMRVYLGFLASQMVSGDG